MQRKPDFFRFLAMTMRLSHRHGCEPYGAARDGGKTVSFAKERFVVVGPVHRVAGETGFGLIRPHVSLLNRPLQDNL